MTTAIDTNTAADITLRSPADLLSAVPYLVGYVPDEALVLVGLANRQVAMTAAMPLSKSDQDRELFDDTAQVLRRNKIEAALVVGYGEPPLVTHCVDRITDILDELDIDIIEALRVTNGRYWSYSCSSLECCPAEGRSLNRPGSVVDTALTVGGLQAMPSREAVVAQLEPVTGAAKAAAGRAAKQVDSLLRDSKALVAPRTVLSEAGAAILTRAIRTGELPDARDTVWLAASLADPKIRSQALVSIDQHDVQQMLRLWLWVTRHVVPPMRAEAAALLGYAAWRAGNGVLASESLRRALSDDPACNLAGMVWRLVSAGMPPSSLPKLTSLDAVAA